MFGKFLLLQKYLRYWFTAANAKGHGIHSPFVFEFITKVLNDNQHYEAYEIVEKQRALLKKDKTVLQIDDQGAGSRSNNNKERSVAAIVRTAVKPPKYGQLLFRIARYYNARNILELGTSLGITTAYLALAGKDSKVVTVEGVEVIAGKATELFRKLELQNIEQVSGNFDEVLPAILNSSNVPDLVFIDGNHRKEPTLRYFDWLLQKKHNETILIFDDIHWSSEMEAAWNTIHNHPGVTLSIDLFFIGIVFFKKEFHAKQHFVIRF